MDKLLNLHGLETFKREKVDPKADANGTYDNLTAGSSEALLSDNYTLEREPYIFRKGNGAREYEEIVGGSVGWNQLCPNLADMSATRCTCTVTDGVATMTVNDAGISAGRMTLSKSPLVVNPIAGHKYLMTFAVNPSVALTTATHLQIGNNIQLYATPVPTTGAWTTYASVITYGTPSGSYVQFDAIGTFASGDTVQLRNAMIIDLTALFGSTVADHLYSLEQATAGTGVKLFKQMFPKSYYPYNAGSLLSVKTSGRKTVGFNQWDEEWEVGGLIWATGAEYAISTSRRTDYIRVIPNATYYVHSPYACGVVWFDSNKQYITNATNIHNTTTTAPSNAYYGRFVWTSVGDGTTYNNDICINISGDRNGQYEPYTSHTYPMSNIDLRGVFKLADGKIYADGDVYSYDGSVTRRYGIVDLGTLNWTYVSGQTRFYSTGVANGKSPTSYGEVANVICAKYTAVTFNDITSGNYDKVIAMVTTTQNVISIRDTAYTDATAFKTAMSGTYLVYEKTTPTTETADAYQHLQFVGSTEEFLDDRTVQVPVGHNSKYLEDLKAKIEGLPWDLSMIAPIENGTTSSKAYAVGEYFLHNNLFCKAKTSIASGATFTLNTNYTVTTIGAELKSLQ